VRLLKPFCRFLNQTVQNETAPREELLDLRSHTTLVSDGAEKTSFHRLPSCQLGKIPFCPPAWRTGSAGCGHGGAAGTGAPGSGRAELPERAEDEDAGERTHKPLERAEDKRTPGRGRASCRSADTRTTGPRGAAARSCCRAPNKAGRAAAAEQLAGRLHEDGMAAWRC
jgi:hypothetical protein